MGAATQETHPEDNDDVVPLDLALLEKTLQVPPPPKTSFCCPDGSGDRRAAGRPAFLRRCFVRPERACSAHRRRACRRQFLGEGDEEEDEAGGGAAARGVQERRWWAMDPERLLYMKTDLEEATDAVLFYVEARPPPALRRASGVMRARGAFSAGPGGLCLESLAPPAALTLRHASARRRRRRAQRARSRTLFSSRCRASLECGSSRWAARTRQPPFCILRTAPEASPIRLSAPRAGGVRRVRGQTLRGAAGPVLPRGRGRRAVAGGADCVPDPSAVSARRGGQGAGPTLGTPATQTLVLSDALRRGAARRPRVRGFRCPGAPAPHAATDKVLMNAVVR
jgi:hypothetical protein